MSGGVHGFLLTDWDVVAVKKLVHRHVSSAGVGRGPDPRARVLLERLERYVVEDCAPQPSQPSADEDRQWWPEDELITVQEAAKIMRCSETNVRKRAALGTLAGLKAGERWALSRVDVLDAAREREGR